MACGLFVGLVTLDCIYQVEHVPDCDEKIVAQESLLLPGGPAANAAVAFAHWGHSTILVGSLGEHPLAEWIATDLAAHGINFRDVGVHLQAPPPLSTVLVTAATGDRAVISRNAVDRQASPEALTPAVLTGVDIVLVDGHQMALSEQVIDWAVAAQIPVVVDAGSWKSGFERILPQAASIIASARFRPPGCASTTDTLAALVDLGIPEVAITQGARPILYCEKGDLSLRGSLSVPEVDVVDTLGAGDIFHGAYCHFRLRSAFVEALEQAAAVAALSCTRFGPRSWLKM